MIRCTTDHQALYTDPATGKRSRTPIIAWDENGNALIVGRAGLVRADWQDGFDRISAYVEPTVRTVTLNPSGAHQ